MALETNENLSNEALLALAYTAPIMRDPLRIFFELDARLARIVGATNEAMLGQMRLAWWRDVLKMEADQRPQGDAVLDGIGEFWHGYEDGLVGLVDAWEWMLAEELDAKSASEFGINRCKPVSALAAMALGSHDKAEPLGRSLAVWAYADAAANISDEQEREVLLNQARAEDPKPRSFPRALRGLDVLAALACRSLARGGRPLMEGRGAALVALRAAIFGR